ncbi:DHH phosphoesterase [Shewanella phage FishSpeaker]|nr:DHH phosphoesterase [Shewanella phage FishSpeaker]
MKKIIIGYHGFCMDGIGSLIVAQRKFGVENVFPVPLDHSKKDESFARLIKTIEENEGVVSSLAILDFAFDFDIMSEIEDICVERNLGLLLIDHHEGMKDEINKFINYSDRNGTEVIFDTGRSGAYLTWEYYFPSIPVPPLLCYIDDGDRYKFNLPSAREVCGTLVYLTGKTDYKELMTHLNKTMDELLTYAGPEYGFITEYVRKTVDLYTVGVRTQELEINGEKLSIILKPCDLAFSSLVGEAYYNIRTDVNAIVMYSGVGKEVNLSIRSGSTFHDGYAKKIAQYFGGNGHPNAAGCKLPRKQFVELFLK